MGNRTTARSRHHDVGHRGDHRRGLGTSAALCLEARRSACSTKPRAKRGVSTRGARTGSLLGCNVVGVPGRHDPKWHKVVQAIAWAVAGLVDSRCRQRGSRGLLHIGELLLAHLFQYRLVGSQDCSVAVKELRGLRCCFQRKQFVFQAFYLAA